MKICKTLGVAVTLLLLSSCSLRRTEFIVQRPGTVMTLSRDAKGVTVLGPDKDGNLIEGTCDLPKGTLIKIAPEEVKKPAE